MSRDQWKEGFTARMDGADGKAGYASVVQDFVSTDTEAECVSNSGSTVVHHWKRG